MTPQDAVPLFLSPFIFLRHGETETNRLGLIAGSTEVELNESGRQQAWRAAELLSSRGVDAIYSSTLRRARDTADCVAAVLGLNITFVSELAERSWGELEGRPRELRVREMTPPGGEGPGEFSARTLAGLRKIPRSQLPLIVAHSGTFRVLSSRLGIAMPPEPIQNSQPVRFVPPPVAGARWSLEIL